MEKRDVRQSWMHDLIGPKMPRLWCPPLTHYTAEGELDVHRIAVHWQRMRPYVGGFLVPGSTGDGWDMAAEEIEALLDVALGLAAQLDTRLLIGVLRTEVAAMVETIAHTMDALRARTGQTEPRTALRRSRVCGFTVCPPQGRDLSQTQIAEGLEAVLRLGVPVAIYQLPQITQNEMEPGLIADLAARYPNFIMFKDSSGTDRVALEDRGSSGVFLVRGAEGRYAEWVREGGGPYDGLLLSTANCFAQELGTMLALLEAGRLEDAQELSDQLTGAIRAIFALAAQLPYGNAFTNANKAMDHFMAYGSRALAMPPPRVHAGELLPPTLIEETGAILHAAGLMPARGYLDAG